MLRVGVVGVGFGAQVQVPGFRAVPGVEVAALASSEGARARAAAQALGVPRAFAGWRDLVASPEVDAVNITSPPLTHAPIAAEALARGKAVLCEKPLAPTAAEAAALTRAAGRSGVPAMVDFEFRELPALRLAKRILDAGALGGIREASANWVVGSWADPARPWSWRSDAAQGGGVLGALAVHTFDQVRWLLGPARAASGRLDVRVRRRPDDRGAWREVTAEDTVHATLELEGGEPVDVRVTCVAPVGEGSWLRVHGEHATLVVGSADVRDYGRDVRAWLGKAGGDLEPLVAPSDLALPAVAGDARIALFAALAGRFAAACRGLATAEPGFADGLEAQRVAEAVRRSSEARRWIPLIDIPGA